MTTQAPVADTIFAPASGQGRAAVAVIRVSGPQTRSILETIAGPVPEPRRMALRRLRACADGAVLDQALVVFFPGPNSFTGEDQAELQIHGGVAVRAAVLRALADMPGCRSAQPGEFTRRALLNGRMDLSAVEGLADLIDSETESQRRQALRQLEGSLGALVEGWRETLLHAMALLEAALDFSDEGDVDAGLEAQAAPMIQSVATEIESALRDGGRGERLREGYVVVIAGPPNAGKSTLLNAIARREVAIVSPVPGTTRDAIEVRCDLAGLPVTFVDTAGLRDTQDLVERVGVARARARLGGADLVLWLDPVDDPALPPAGLKAVHVVTKTDLGTVNRGDAALSVARGDGLDALLTLITERACAEIGLGDAVITRLRHRQAFERAFAALQRAHAGLHGEHLELAAEDLRLALRAIGEVTGRVDVEEVLDRLFGSFCIGK